MCVCLRLAMTFHEMTPDILTWHASSGENFRPPVQIGLWLVHVGTAGLGLGYEIGLGLGLYAGFSDTGGGIFNVWPKNGNPGRHCWVRPCGQLWSVVSAGGQRCRLMMRHEDATQTARRRRRLVALHY